MAVSAGRSTKGPSFGRFVIIATLVLAAAVPLPAYAAYPGPEGYYPPGYDTTKYPANYNPFMVISDDNWRAGTAMSQADIQAFLETQEGVLKTYSCAEGGPNGLHSQVVKPASQIIAEAAQYWNVNPKLIIATLEKEQSLITQPYPEALGGALTVTSVLGSGSSFRLRIPRVHPESAGA